MSESLETSERDARPYTPPPHTSTPLHDPNAILHRIEREVGHDHLHWGQVDPHELIRTVLKHIPGLKPDSCGFVRNGRVTWDIPPPEEIHLYEPVWCSQHRHCSSPAVQEVVLGWEDVAKQALDALLAQQNAIDGVPTGPERQVQWAIDALRAMLAASTAATEAAQQATPGDIEQFKQQPFAYFKYEASKGVWSQVMPASAGQPGVIAAYANPQSLTELEERA